jgi:hypothetical protein
MYRPCEDPHGNTLATQLDPVGDPNGKRVTDVSTFKKVQGPAPKRALSPQVREANKDGNIVELEEVARKVREKIAKNDRKAPVDLEEMAEVTRALMNPQVRAGENQSSVRYKPSRNPHEDRRATRPDRVADPTRGDARETKPTGLPSPQIGFACTKDIQEVFASTARMIRDQVRREQATFCRDEPEAWATRATKPGFMKTFS